MPSGDSDNGRRWLPVKIGVIAVALAGAVYFGFFRGRAESLQLDTPESAMPYVCLKCGHVFDLTPRAFDEMIRAGKVSSGRERGAPLMLQCPKCAEMAATQGMRCPKHPDVVVPLSSSAGKPAKCPKCGWVPGSE